MREIMLARFTNETDANPKTLADRQMKYANECANEFLDKFQKLFPDLKVLFENAHSYHLGVIVGMQYKDAEEK